MPASRRSVVRAPYGPYIRKAVSAAKTAYNVGSFAYNAYNHLRGKMRGRSRGGVLSSQGVSVQHDSRRVYTRKRASKRVRRAAKKKYRRFLASTMKLLGTRTVLMNRQLTMTAGVAQQIFDSVVLYGGAQAVYGTASDRGYDDMKEIIFKDYLMADTTGDAERRWSAGGSKLFFDTGILDCTIQNTSLTSELGAGSAIELDIYEFTTRKFDCYPTVHEGIVGALTYSPIQASGLTALSVYQRGFTPFEAPEACKMMGFRIIKKTKYFIPYGDVVTYQIRDSKNHVLSSSDVLLNADSTTNWTRGLLFIGKVLPTNAETGIASLKIGMTRKYKYKIMESNNTRAGYAPLV